MTFMSLDGCYDFSRCTFLIHTDDVGFLTGTGLKRVGVTGLDQDRYRVELEDVGSSGIFKDSGDVQLWAPI